MIVRHRLYASAINSTRVRSELLSKTMGKEKEKKMKKKSRKMVTFANVDESMTRGGKEGGTCANGTPHAASCQFKITYRAPPCTHSCSFSYIYELEKNKSSRISSFTVLSTFLNRVTKPFEAITIYFSQFLKHTLSDVLCICTREELGRCEYSKHFIV